MNIADAVLIIFILGMIVLGIMKGFASMVISLFAGIIAFLISAILARPIATLLSAWSLFDGLREKIRDFFLNTAESAASSIQQIVDNLGVPEFIRDSLLKDMDPGQSILAAAQQLADRVFYYILLAIAFIFLLIVIRILFSLVEKAFEGIFTKVKLLDVANKVLGALFSLVQSALVIYIVLGILAMIASGIPGTISVITESVLVSKIYYNNLLLQIFI
jgi:uncharacterized membrane protein required for colicin V production